MGDDHHRRHLCRLRARIPARHRRRARRLVGAPTLRAAMRGARAFAAVVGLVAAPVLPAQELVIGGTCRDGEPQGAYTLRAPDGRLRVAGALARGRRTGTFLFWSERGSRIAVIPYDDARKMGTVAVWYAASSPG